MNSARIVGNIRGGRYIWREGREGDISNREIKKMNYARIIGNIRGREIYQTRRKGGRYLRTILRKRRDIIKW